MQSYLVITEPLPVQDPLAEWRWKLGGDATLVTLTRAGDAFVAYPDGTISWLDTGAGSVQRIAATRQEFDEVMADPTEARRLLLAPVVEESVRLHGSFPDGVCLGFTQLPVLGGAYSIDNRFRLPAVEHFAVTGDLHRQMRDVPDGTGVQVRVVD